MFRLTLILVTTFWFNFSYGQNFTTTFDVDYLNDGKKKSVLFTNEKGEFLYMQNFKPKGFQKDFVIEFDRMGSSEVHLTVFKKRLDNSRPYKKRTAETFCNILNNSIMNYFGEENEFEILASIDAALEREKKTIEITGVFSLEDLVDETENYSISSSKVKKDSTLKLKIEHQPGRDLLIFMKINGEDSYRELLLSFDEKSPVKLMLDDLGPDVEVMELNFPYEDYWNSSVMGLNPKMGDRFPLHASSHSKKKTEFTIYPSPQEVSLSKYLVHMSRIDSKTGLRHIYRQFFDYAPSEIFHYDRFDFGLENEFNGFVLDVADESDYFEITAAYNGMSRTTTSTITLFPWYFFGKIKGKQKVKIVYPEEIPEKIQDFIGGNWNALEVDIKRLEMLKLAYPTKIEDWERPMDYFYILRDDSFHQCIQSFRN